MFAHMKTMQQWLDEYGESHRNPVNKAIHWVCVPLILFSILGLLWGVPVPQPVAAAAWVNWATLLAAAALVYYAVLSGSIAAGMLVVVLIMFGLIAWLEQAVPVPPWIVYAAIFAAAWIGQFIGHRIEGRKPSFFKDLQFLLIGPAWLMADAYRRAGIAY